MKRIDVGTKWFTLNVGDHSREGDELFVNHVGWIELPMDTIVNDYMNVRRRKPDTIKPMDGYRLLKEGEVLLEGDEYFTHSHGKYWRPTARPFGVVQEGEIYRRQELILNDDMEEPWEKLLFYK